MDKLFEFIKKKKKLFVIVLIVVLLVGGRIFLLQKPDTALTYTVQKEDLADTVQVTGKYTVASQTEVFSPTNGVITEIFVSNGSLVEKGEVLFKVESTATSQEEADAYASYQSALSTLKTAEQTKLANDAVMWTEHRALLDAREAKRYKDENTTNPTTKKDYTDLEKESIDAAVVQAEKDFISVEQKYKVSDSGIASAKAQVSATLLKYQATQNTTVIAPAAGTVVNLLKKEREQVMAKSTNSSSSQGESSSNNQDEASSVLMIANLNNPYLDVSINEAYMPRLAIGQKVSIVFDALKNETFMGKIESLDTVGKEASGLISYSARVVSDEISSTIKPNMTALLTIETFRKDDVLTIPNTAIITKDGKTFVTKKINSQKETVEVKTAEKGLTKTVITSGLSEGDVVITNPNTE